MLLRRRRPHPSRPRLRPHPSRPRRRPHPSRPHPRSPHRLFLSSRVTSRSELKVAFLVKRRCGGSEEQRQELCRWMDLKLLDLKQEDVAMNVKQEDVLLDDGGISDDAPDTAEYSLDEPTMAEKLEAVDLLAEAAGGVAGESLPMVQPSADSVHVLLRQALRADDRAELLGCLYNRDGKVVCSSSLGAPYCAGAAASPIAPPLGLLQNAGVL